MEQPPKHLANLIALARDGLAVFASDRSKTPAQVAEVATDVALATAWVEERLAPEKPEGE